MFVTMDKVLVYLPTKLGYLVLSQCVSPPWVCLDIPSFLAIESNETAEREHCLEPSSLLGIPVFRCCLEPPSFLPFLHPSNCTEEVCEFSLGPEVATLFGRE